MTTNTNHLDNWIDNANTARQHPSPPADNDSITVADRAQRITEAVDHASRSKPEDLQQALVNIYAEAADFADGILLPAIQRSPHVLSNDCAQDFSQDLHEHLAASCEHDNMMSRTASGTRPDANNQDADEWRRWTSELCLLLQERAGAHEMAIDIIQKAELDIYEGTSDQVLINCYTVSTSIAGSAARWATAHTAPNA